MNCAIHKRMKQPSLDIYLFMYLLQKLEACKSRRGFFAFIRLSKRWLDDWLVCSFTQVFEGHLLYVRYCSRPGGSSQHNNNKSPDLYEIYILMKARKDKY